MIKAIEFVSRRNKLFDRIDDNSVVILFSGLAKKSTGDETYPFIANTNFFYLTNVSQEGSAYIMVKTDGLLKEFLFIKPRDIAKEKWVGRRLTIEEAGALGDIENTLTMDQFEAKLDGILRGAYGVISKVYLDLDPEQKLYGDGDNVQTEKSFSFVLKSNYRLPIVDVYTDIAELRLVKTQVEVDEFTEAVEKTNIGLKKLLKTLKPGLYEYQLSSLFYYTIQDYDHSELSFDTIAASGKNGTCLHYPFASSKLENGDLILFDLGSKNNGYCADISRTYPVNGRYGALQKKIYNIVLNCNKYIISIMRPGISLGALNDETIKFLGTECVKAGLIKDKSEISKYYFHSVSHHIGLDTHDVSRLRDLDKDKYLNRPLEKGNIISCEPGLYFEELGIGVRIEDDILITEEGSYNLSANIIKDPEEIEKVMKFEK